MRPFSSRAKGRVTSVAAMNRSVICDSEMP